MRPRKGNTLNKKTKKAKCVRKSKFNWGGGDKSKGNLLLKVPRKRERKMPPNKLEEQKVKEGRKERRQIKPDKK